MKRTLSGSHIPVPDHHNQHWTLSFFSIEWSWKHVSTPCTLSKCSPHCLGPNSALYWQKWTGPNVEGNCTCGTTIAAKPSVKNMLFWSVLGIFYRLRAWLAEISRAKQRYLFQIWQPDHQCHDQPPQCLSFFLQKNSGKVKRRNKEVQL